MENKPKFNKDLFTTIALQKFLTDYARVGKVENAYSNLLNLNKNNDEKRIILENCKSLFEIDSMRKEVDREIATIRTAINTTQGRNPTDSEVAKWLIKCFSEEIFAVEKRTYDMSKLPAKGSLCPIKTAKGKTSRKIAYASFEQIQEEKHKKDGATLKRPEKFLEDNKGNPIHIQFLGILTFGTPNGNKSICKYAITKTVDGINQEYEKYTKIDIPALRLDKSLCNVISSELLSEKNLNRSNADDYIGEILEESLLKPGDEKLDGNMYTYQINSRHALVYDGEALEAVRTYKQQEAMIKNTQQIKSHSQTLSEDEPEI